MKQRCTVVELSKPYRKLTLPEKSKRVLKTQLLYLAQEAASQHSAAIA